MSTRIKEQRSSKWSKLDAIKESATPFLELTTDLIMTSWQVDLSQAGNNISKWWDSLCWHWHLRKYKKILANLCNKKSGVNR